MRIAVILAILVQYLDNDIFQPSYILGEFNDVHDIMCSLAAKDSEKESFCRGLILSINPDKEKSVGQKRIENVTRNMMQHLDGFLPSPKHAEFEAELSQLVHSSYDTWAGIRTARERYEPVYTKEMEGFDLNTLSFGDAIGPVDQNMAIQGVKDDDILHIFPRLYVIENNQKRVIVEGTVLRRSQSLAAAQEVDGQQREVPRNTGSRRRTNSGRRQVGISNSPDDISENGTFLD
jgi:hypothetical protein